MNKKRGFHFNPNPKPFKPRPMGKRADFTPYRAQPQTRRPEPEEEEPYWSAEDWEEWAEDQYLNNPDAVLPAWFVAYMEEEEEEE